MAAGGEGGQIDERTSLGERQQTYQCRFAMCGDGSFLGRAGELPSRRFPRLAPPLHAPPSLQLLVPLPLQKPAVEMIAGVVPHALTTAKVEVVDIPEFVLTGGEERKSRRCSPHSKMIRH